MRKTLEERYWAKVDKRGPDDCWPWTAATTPKGYGIFHDEINHSRLAARWAHERFIGPLDGLLICHTCDNPRCQNPAHWFLGTHKDNHADRAAKGRSARNIFWGEEHGCSKITDVQRLEIREKRATMLLRELAAEYRLSMSGIRHVLNSPHDYA